MVAGPSRRMTCSRWARARSHSSSVVLDPNADRYRNGPEEVRHARAPVSEAQRRGSPVRWIEVVVEPWYER